MKVYFSASARHLQTDLAHYRRIIRAVQRQGGIIVYNWIEVAKLRANFPTEREWWEDICRDASQALMDADVVIVEASGGSTLGVGYELATALQNGKPTLALIKKGNSSDSYVRGLSHNLLAFVVYTERSLAGQIRRFIDREGR